ncbi:MAG: response regulator [Opitutaceae bacterium]|nr:response regulator [Opitutaceae bacterium]
MGEQMPRSLDAVIDVVMPYLGGLATIRALHKMNPSLKFIQISGGMDAVESADAVQSSANAFLQKPFSPEQLLEAVHEVLREPDSDAG